MLSYNSTALPPETSQAVRKLALARTTVVKKRSLCHEKIYQLLSQVKSDFLFQTFSEVQRLISTFRCI